MDCSIKTGGLFRTKKMEDKEIVLVTGGCYDLKFPFISRKKSG
ncbi:hypothetical protein RYH73_08175 [Olivibacter sp. CPCC 100613]